VLDADQVRQVVDWTWEEAVLPVLTEYTKIPALSPAFDRDWERRGALHQATEMLWEWAANRPIPGLRARIVEHAGLTPLLVVDIEGSVEGSVEGSGQPVLLYGHLDKQPPLGTWAEGLDAFTPVRRGDRLYGRGTADDGYALFAALTAIEAAIGTGVSLPRCLVLIEASEESGSPDLAAHLEQLELDEPSLVVCLDSGCVSYDRLWVTTSLRGIVVADLAVDVLTEGVHSGQAGGIVPSSFRLLRRLLSRIEDEETGAIRLAEAHADPPAWASGDAADLAESTVTAGPHDGGLPIVPGLRLAGADPSASRVLGAWSAALEVTGMDGVPAVAHAGNVLRPSTKAKLSLRVPPTCDAGALAEALRTTLLADPPDGAHVTVELEASSEGWVAPPSEPWLADAVDTASRRYFGAPAGRHGEGGTIPFLPSLQRRFPRSQFLATGVLGPGSNAHGPNEMLHLPTAKALTACIAEVLASVPQAAPR
jgi:acetylornithine deacetylase/succinyl-diaminopimelate desuccinylase-like protein